MAYPTDHILLSYGGSIYDGGEEWTNTLRLFGVGAEAGGTEEADQTQCATYAEIIRTWWAAYDGSSARCKLGWVKMNRLNAAGEYKHPWTALVDFSPEEGNDDNLGSNVPAQVALVATFRTAARRGLAHSGRIFLPMPVRTLSADGRLNTTDRDMYVTEVKQLLDNINAQDTSMYVGIGSKINAGQIRRVLRVEVGRVYDTMRSRRTNLSEEHAGQDLGAP